MGEQEDKKRKTGTLEERFSDEVGRKAERKLRARRERNRTAWFWLGMFGLVGWSVAVPTLIGIAMGIWIDNTWPDGISWTLNLLIIGIIVGCINAWYWVQRESHRD